MTAGRNVIRGTSELDITNTSQDNRPFAILRRFDGVSLVNRSIGRLKHPESRLDFLQRGFRFELASHDHHHIVWPIVLAIKLAQFDNRDAFDIAAITDCTLAIVVPFVGGSLHALHQDSTRRIFAALEFVAHNRHFTG